MEEFTLEVYGRLWSGAKAVYSYGITRGNAVEGVAS
jgi:hypothetical protein